MKGYLAFAVLALSLSSCATVLRDGFELDEAFWKKQETEVTARAAFDFQCPKERLQLTVLRKRYGMGAADQVAVRGCDRQGVYVYSPSGWVLNSNNDSGTSPQK